jgi:hypothetical protein
VSRPPHIAAIDTALDDAVAKATEADEHVRATLDLHIDALDAINAALNDRASAYGDVQACEDAIRKLGYVVLDGKGGTLGPNSRRLSGYSALQDESDARDRRIARGPRQARPGGESS